MNRDKKYEDPKNLFEDEEKEEKKEEETRVFNSIEEAMKYEEEKKDKEQEKKTVKKEENEKVENNKKGKINNEEKEEVDLSNLYSVEKDKEGLSEFIEKAKEDKKYKDIYKYTNDENYDPKWPSFEEIMEWKYIYKKVIMVFLDSNELPPTEENKIGNFLVIRPLMIPEYSRFLRVIGNVSENESFFLEYVMQNNILFPEMTNEIVESTEAGVLDRISKEILSKSKFDIDYSIREI